MTEVLKLEYIPVLLDYLKKLKFWVMIINYVCDK